MIGVQYDTRSNMVRFIVWQPYTITHTHPIAGSSPVLRGISLYTYMHRCVMCTVPRTMCMWLCQVCTLWTAVSAVLVYLKIALSLSLSLFPHFPSSPYLPTHTSVCVYLVRATVAFIATVCVQHPHTCVHSEYTDKVLFSDHVCPIVPSLHMYMYMCYVLHSMCPHTVVVCMYVHTYMWVSMLCWSVMCSYT